MSTKALKTQLLAAVAMVLVASVALGSSTYAWFASNNKVTADGMSVSAKTDNIYLIIGKGDADLDTIQAANDTTATAEQTLAYTELKPAALATEATKEDVKVASISGSGYSVAQNWYTASAALRDNAAAKTDTEAKLTALNGYVNEYTYNLCLAKGSTASGALTVNSCTFSGKETDKGADDTFKAVKAVIVCGENAVQFSAEGNVSVPEDAARILADSVTASGLTTVKVYVYYDGNHADVRSNNVANLKGASVAIEFGVADA